MDAMFEEFYTLLMFQDVKTVTILTIESNFYIGLHMMNMSDLIQYVFEIVKHT